MLGFVQRVVRGIKYRLYKLTKWILRFIPVKKNLWVYGCWNGKIYADNPKYMFEYMNETHPEITNVWITRSKDVCTKIKNDGYRCYLSRSLKGVWLCVCAEVAFVTITEEADISPYLDYKKTKVIQLWHGFGAKQMKWDFGGGSTIKNQGQRNNEYYWMSSSDYCTEVLSGNVGIGTERFYITGFPRNDTFIYKPRNEYIERIHEKYPDHKLVIYMPTHRNFGKTTTTPDNLQFIDSKLKEMKVVLVYKPHLHELDNSGELEDNFTNIILATDSSIWSDVYSYIHYFDALISDYSSISYDFLCSGKPIVQFVYDIDDYKQNDGGLLDFFWEIPIGPFTYTWEDTLISLKRMLYEEDEWVERRRNALKHFFYYNDGNNRKRVYDKVIEIRNKNDR